VTAIVRGDHDVNETKLVNAVTAIGGLRPAQAEEIRAAGMEPGYGSPVGAHDTVVVVDELVARSPNLVAGANRAGRHLRNVNVGRDFTPDVTADIANARAGDACPNCGQPVRLANGIEVGNIFKLGDDFTRSLNATYLAEDGSRRHPVMGSYGIGLGRALACIVEEHHDDKGIIWPVAVAPYRAHLVAIGAHRDDAVRDAADGLYARLTDAGVSVLYDDRDESPGVKFTDAELLGMPTIVTISPRALAAGGAEVTDRASGERGIRAFDELEAELAGS
jgi:prolyl-tRNA synthetase